MRKRGRKETLCGTINPSIADSHSLAHRAQGDIHQSNRYSLSDFPVLYALRPGKGDTAVGAGQQRGQDFHCRVALRTGQVYQCRVMVGTDLSV